RSAVNDRYLTWGCFVTPDNIHKLQAALTHKSIHPDSVTTTIERKSIPVKQTHHLSPLTDTPLFRGAISLEAFLKHTSLVYRAIVLLIVVVPLLATALAIGLLWQRAVHWSDVILLVTIYTLVALGVTVGFH